MAETWSIDDYRGPQGARPVRDILDGLSKTARPRVYAALAMLEEHGNRARMPQSRALGNGLHELRIPHAEGPFRVIYCYLPGRRIVLLHAFVKRTEQTPPGELRAARTRQRDIG